MSNVYVVIEEFMDANVGELFFVSNDDASKYYCVQNPEIIIDVATIIFYIGNYFALVPVIDALHKLAAIARKDFDLVDWTPAIGHYFTSYNDNLEVFEIQNIVGPDADYMLLYGDNITGIVETVNLDTLVNDYIQVLWEDGSGSGSGSGS